MKVKSSEVPECTDTRENAHRKPKKAQETSLGRLQFAPYF